MGIILIVVLYYIILIILYYIDHYIDMGIIIDCQKNKEHSGAFRA